MRLHGLPYRAMSRTVSAVALFAGLGVGAALAADVTTDRIVNADKEPQNWLTNHRDYTGQRYSPLTEINRDNVKNLNISVDVAPGQTQTVTINAPAGDYYFFCNVPGHEEAGMHGMMHVK